MKQAEETYVDGNYAEPIDLNLDHEATNQMSRVFDWDEHNPEHDAMITMIGKWIDTDEKKSITIEKIMAQPWPLKRRIYQVFASGYYLATEQGSLLSQLQSITRE